jgi:DNA-binding MarR family transcriptional regulator
MMAEEKNLRPASSEDLDGLFHRIAKLMARGRHRGGHGRHTQRRVLSILLEQGPTSQSELLEMLDVRSSSLSEVLGKLERHGWITRERSENDKRVFLVSATEEARGLGAESGGGRRECSDGIFACLNDEERAQLFHLMEKIVASVEDEAEAGRRNGVFGRRPHGRMRRDDGLGHEGEDRLQGFGSGRRGRDRHGRGRGEKA